MVQLLVQQELSCDECDITSRLPNDITMTMVTLAMGHGQTVTSRLRGDVMGQGVTSRLLTDVTVKMVTLTVEC